MLYKVNILIAQ